MIVWHPLDNPHLINLCKNQVKHVCGSPASSTQSRITKINQSTGNNIETTCAAMKTGFTMILVNSSVAVTLFGSFLCGRQKRT